MSRIDWGRNGKANGNGKRKRKRKNGKWKKEKGKRKKETLWCANKNQEELWKSVIERFLIDPRRNQDCKIWIHFFSCFGEFETSWFKVLFQFSQHPSRLNHSGQVANHHQFSSIRRQFNHFQMFWILITLLGEAIVHNVFIGDYTKANVIWGDLVHLSQKILHGIKSFLVCHFHWIKFNLCLFLICHGDGFGVGVVAGVGVKSILIRTFLFLTFTAAVAVVVAVVAVAVAAHWFVIVSRIEFPLEIVNCALLFWVWRFICLFVCLFVERVRRESMKEGRKVGKKEETFQIKD